RGHFPSLAACFGEADGNGLFPAGHFLSRAALQSSPLELVHFLFHFVRRFLPIFRHGNSSFGSQKRQEMNRSLLSHGVASLRSDHDARNAHDRFQRECSKRRIEVFQSCIAARSMRTTSAPRAHGNCAFTASMADPDTCSSAVPEST